MPNMEREDGLRRYEGRHPGVRELMGWLFPNPRLEGVAMDVSQVCWIEAESLVDILEDGPELTAGLRHLLEAKDCFVRQGLKDCGVV